jgi:methionyl-tRNA formyltransferase
MKLVVTGIERVVLLGGGKMLVALARLFLSKGTPLSVVTSPRHSHEKVGGGLTLKDFLELEKINFIVAEDIRSGESKSFLSDLSKAFCLSIGSAWIFKDDVIGSIFKNRLFNLHGTRLPQNRGGGGFSWQIMMGNRLGFCQLHLIDSGVDTGDIVRTKEFLYPPSCRKPIDYEKLYIEMNLNFVSDLIEEIRTTGVAIETVRQSEYFSTYWPRLNTGENAWINWNDSVESIERFICAFDEPYEGAKTFLNDNKVFVKEVSVDYSDPQFHSYQAGIIFRKNSKWISVCSNGGTLIIQEIWDEGGNNLIERVKVGDRFFTPYLVLSERNKRISYTPSGPKL